nr:hypothetical protein [Tanacetum cinerariifolium]
MTRGRLATTIRTLRVRENSTITPKVVVGRCMSKVARWDEWYEEKDDVQLPKNDVHGKDKVYEEHEESCWIPDPRTGIYYPKGHEWVMKDVPVGAARLAYTYWLRNSDNHGV